MSDATLELASRRRIEAAADEEFDRTLRTLLEHYQTVTSNPRSMGYLRFLLKHYAGKAHPWQACYKDNLKRFGPKTGALCGVLKDVIRQNTHWRHGRGGHPGSPDAGSPGVAIGEADAPAAPPFGGHHNLKLSQLEVPEIPEEIQALLSDLANCDPCRVLLGLDEPPKPSSEYLEAVHST